jgi:flagellar biosynthesis protein FliQ
MDLDTAVELVRQATYLGLMIGAPVLAVSIIIGLAISILQAVTQIQEQTLSFVPKIIVMVLTLLLVLPWALERMVDYSSGLYRDIPSNF